MAKKSSKTGKGRRTKRLERIGIIVVHGVGEQRRFEFLESFASNLYKAISKLSGREPHIQIRHGDQVPRLSPEHSWREAPVLVRWKKADGGEIEAAFREVHWADLDLSRTWRRWVKLVGWSLGISGVRLFVRSGVGKPEEHGMCPPIPLNIWRRLLVRLQLFIVSLMFLVALTTIDLFRWIVRRLSFRWQWLESARILIYNYLGDVKLYQDWFAHRGERMETLGEKSRVAIRRRMIRALVQIAKEIESRQLDGYYIFAHSLGTVVAFNGLMETDLALPNYLTQEEWLGLPAVLKNKVAKPLPEYQMPKRAPWLDKPKTAGKHDAINRKRLFQGLRGFLTIGSPLDKFAALWPAIVPVNGASIGAIPGGAPWFNVADVQDIVAGKLDQFAPCKRAPDIGGLKLKNFDWGDQLFFFLAHTSYWKASKGKRQRLIDRIVPWIEGASLRAPDNALSPFLARVIYWFSLGIVGLLLLWLLAYGVWGILNRASSFFDEPLLSGASRQWLESLGLIGHYADAIVPTMFFLFVVGVAIVVACSVVRWLWETAKFRRPNDG